jgi:UPF0042 nucleotide-binding protein
LLLPRFVEEGKKYAGIAVGCTGGRHRSVFVVRCLADWLAGFSDGGMSKWRVVSIHRELMTRTRPEEPRKSRVGTEDQTSGGAFGAAAGGNDDMAGASVPAQAQEA